MQPQNPTSQQGISTTEWIATLDKILQLTDLTPKTRLRASLNCKLINDTPYLFLPSEMEWLQPELLSYIENLTQQHGIELVEDRRKLDIEPISERRYAKPTDLALGVSLLLKQTGIPGPAHCLSVPHMLKAGNEKIDVTTLIRMASAVYPEAKRVVFRPNRFLTGDFDADCEPVTGYACKVIHRHHKTTVSYFNSPDFHAVGYITNDQFVLHVLLAGGTQRNTGLWSPFRTLTDSTFRCQVFTGNQPEQNFGLLYHTFYIDLERSIEDVMGWSNSKLGQRNAG